jgi:hypothetical protein
MLKLIMSNIKHKKAGKTAQVATLLSSICEVNGSDLNQNPRHHDSSTSLCWLT